MVFISEMKIVPSLVCMRVSYEPSDLERSLRKKNSNVIAVLIEHFSNSFLSSNYVIIRFPESQERKKEDLRFHHFTFHVSFNCTNKYSSSPQISSSKFSYTIRSLHVPSLGSTASNLSFARSLFMLHLITSFNSTPATKSHIRFHLGSRTLINCWH